MQSSKCLLTSHHRGSQGGMVLLPGRHPAMSGEIFGCHTWRAEGERVVLAALPQRSRDAAEHPVMHRTALYNR